MTTLAHPVAPSRHAPGVVAAHQNLLPKAMATGVGTLSEARLRRRARRQGLILLAFSSLISLGSIVTFLSWIL
jgi:hypothetical protein